MVRGVVQVYREQVKEAVQAVDQSQEAQLDSVVAAARNAARAFNERVKSAMPKRSAAALMGRAQTVLQRRMAAAQLDFENKALRRCCRVSRTTRSYRARSRGRSSHPRASVALA